MENNYYLHIMNKEELLELIRTGEGYTLEFKRSLSNNIDKEICAFANSSGGKILLGVDDSGEITGYNLTNPERAKIQDIARNMDPPFSVKISQIDNVAIIEVPEGKDKPYAVRGHFYMRIGSNSQQLNRNEIRNFFQREGLLLFDHKPNPDFDLEKDFDVYKFESYIKKAGISDNLNRKDLLRNLSLLDGDKMKNAGVLFFCHRVTKFFLNAVVVCVLYKGNTKTNILDKKEFNADLLSNYENAFVYLASKLNTQYIIKKERTEKLELPEEALREAIVNAIVHRDYFSNGHIQIDIFKDRVEISNPGGLVPGLSRKDFGRRSLPRNPLLMDLMLRINKVERIGSGIQRIKDSMKNYGLKVDFDITENWFSVVFERKVGKRLAERLVEGLAESQKKILELVAENPKISKEEMSNKVGISTTAIDKNIKALKEKGLLRRVGSPKTGHWEVVEEE